LGFLHLVPHLSLCFSNIFSSFLCWVVYRTCTLFPGSHGWWTHFVNQCMGLLTLHPACDCCLRCRLDGSTRSRDRSGSFLPVGGGSPSSGLPQPHAYRLDGGRAKAGGNLTSCGAADFLTYSHHVSSF